MNKESELETQLRDFNEKGFKWNVFGQNSQCVEIMRYDFNKKSIEIVRYSSDGKIKTRTGEKIKEEDYRILINLLKEARENNLHYYLNSNFFSN